MSDVFALVTWLVVPVVALALGYFVVRGVRRWAQQEVKADTFTFQDLRDMRARGDISEREFAVMRDTLLAQVQQDADLKPSNPSTPPAEPPSSSPQTD